MFEISIKLDKKSIKDLDLMDEKVKTGLQKAFKKIALLMESEVKTSFGRTNKPQIRTGTLRRSIESGYDKTSAWVGSNLIYAGIQELGGTIKPRTGRDYLTFQIGGSWVKVRTVTIPARPFLEPAVKENIGRFSKIIQDSVTEETNK